MVTSGNTKRVLPDQTTGIVVSRFVSLRSPTLPHVAFALSPGAFSEVFSPESVDRVRRQARLGRSLVPGATWKRHVRGLREVEVLFSGWGAPVMDEEFLERAPRLKAVFYAAGSVRYFTTPELWRRGVRVSSAHAINAIPVAEYALGAVLLGLKHFWHYNRLVRTQRGFPVERPVVGAYGGKIGLLGYGTVARELRARLRAFQVEVLAHDPLLAQAEATHEGVRLVSLEELFATSDVVSIHAKLNPDSYGLVTAPMLRRLRHAATLINTACGELINENDLVAVLSERPDLQAVLDVASPEPPVRNSPLYELPNVALTPHIAGSLGRECLRLGEAMVDEFERYVAGRPLRWEIKTQ